MRLTINAAFRDRVKQHTNNKEQLNRKEYKKCAQKYPPTQGPYSDEQRQQATRYTSIKDNRRTYAATKRTYPISTTENWISPPAKLLLE